MKTLPLCSELVWLLYEQLVAVEHEELLLDLSATVELVDFSSTVVDDVELLLPSTVEVEVLSVDVLVLCSFTDVLEVDVLELDELLASTVLRVLTDVVDS